MGLFDKVARKAIVKSAKKVQRPLKSGAIDAPKRVAVEAEPEMLKKARQSRYVQETSAKTSTEPKRSNYQQKVEDKKADTTKASQRGATTSSGGRVATRSDTSPTTTGSRSITTGQSGSREVAPVTRVEARRVKDMGMVEDVTPARKAIGNSSKPNAKRSGAIGAAAAAASVSAAMSSDRKTEKSSAKSRSDASATTPAKKTAEKPKSDMAKAQSNVTPSNAKSIAKSPSRTKSSGTSSFGTAFKNARAAGLKTFTWNGKKYNTMQKGETQQTYERALKNIKSRNESAYEKKIQELAKKK